jgi:hypothetical protein
LEKCPRESKAFHLAYEAFDTLLTNHNKSKRRLGHVMCAYFGTIEETGLHILMGSCNIGLISTLIDMFVGI